MIPANDMRTKIDVYRNIWADNDIGERDLKPVYFKRIWAEILPVTATSVRTMQNVDGGMEYSDITHKVTVRKNALPDIANDMFFMISKQKLDVRYFIPHYKYNDRIVVFCNESFFERISVK